MANIKYITTEKAHIFPSTFRTENGAESKYTSEDNITKLIRTLTNNRDFYVINGADKLIVIHGYIFNVNTSDLTDPLPAWAYIKVDKTGRLISNKDDKGLDADGKFIGLTFVTGDTSDPVPPSTETYTVYSLNIADPSKQLPIGSEAINGFTNGILDVSKGGTGKSDLAEVHVGEATNVTDKIKGKSLTDIFESDGLKVKNATTADNLSTKDIGEATKPIYFKDGVPVVCNNEIASCAASAKKLTVGTKGSTTLPVYFNDGNPDAVSTTDTIGIISKLAVNLSKAYGNTNRIVYFGTGGAPAEGITIWTGRDPGSNANAGDIWLSY